MRRNVRRGQTKTVSSGGGLPGGALCSFLVCFLIFSALSSSFFPFDLKKSPNLATPPLFFFFFLSRLFWPSCLAAHPACLSALSVQPFCGAPVYVVSVGFFVNHCPANPSLLMFLPDRPTLSHGYSLLPNSPFYPTCQSLSSLRHLSLPPSTVVLSRANHQKIEVMPKKCSGCVCTYV